MSILVWSAKHDLSIIEHTNMGSLVTNEPTNIVYPCSLLTLYRPT